MNITRAGEATHLLFLVLIPKWCSTGDDISFPGVFCQCLETFPVVTSRIVWRILLNTLQCIGQAIKNDLAPNDNNVVGAYFAHCRMFSSISGFYPLNASSILHPPPLQVMKTRNASTVPERAKLPLLRTSAFRGNLYLNFIFVISLLFT